MPPNEDETQERIRKLEQSVVRLESERDHMVERANALSESDRNVYRIIEELQHEVRSHAGQVREAIKESEKATREHAKNLFVPRTEAITSTSLRNTLLLAIALASFLVTVGSWLLDQAALQHAATEAAEYESLTKD